MPKMHEFTVGFAVRLWVDTDIKAENYDQALAKAREMKVADLVTVDVECNDSNMRLISITDMDALDKVSD